ncbi:MAG: hypothetical protein NVSMB12_19890 [Acidimicrobiales bacterium]
MRARVVDADCDEIERLRARVVEQGHKIDRLTADLAAAARTDPLTGLPNRIRLDEDLATMQGRMDRYGHQACVAMFDVDHLKRVNEQFGHAKGDVILREVAAVLAGALRAGDVAYRSGGPEFVALFPEIDATRGRSAAERVRQLVEKAGIAHPGSAYGVVTVSVGVAASAGQPVTPISELVVRADRSLRIAKALGRNRVEIDPGDRCGRQARGEHRTGWRNDSGGRAGRETDPADGIGAASGPAPGVGALSV